MICCPIDLFSSLPVSHCAGNVKRKETINATRFSQHFCIHVSILTLTWSGGRREREKKSVGLIFVLIIALELQIQKLLFQI